MIASYENKRYVAQLQVDGDWFRFDDWWDYLTYISECNNPFAKAMGSMPLFAKIADEWGKQLGQEVLPDTIYRAFSNENYKHIQAVIDWVDKNEDLLDDPSIYGGGLMFKEIYDLKDPDDRERYQEDFGEEQ